MENTLENKAAFFAQYWGQEVLNWDDKITNGLSRVEAISEISEGEALDFYFLELTTLSQISDEDLKRMRLDLDFDALGFDNQKRIKDWVQELDRGLLLGSSDIILKMFFWLICQGYALPFRGVDVETLISWGWVKLKTKKE